MPFCSKMQISRDKKQIAGCRFDQSILEKKMVRNGVFNYHGSIVFIIKFEMTSADERNFVDFQSIFWNSWLLVNLKKKNKCSIEFLAKKHFEPRPQKYFLDFFYHSKLAENRVFISLISKSKTTSKVNFSQNPLNSSPNTSKINVWKGGIAIPKENFFFEQV